VIRPTPLTRLTTRREAMRVAVLFFNLADCTIVAHGLNTPANKLLPGEYLCFGCPCRSRTAALELIGYERFWRLPVSKISFDAQTFIKCGWYFYCLCYPKYAVFEPCHIYSNMNVKLFYTQSKLAPTLTVNAKIVVLKKKTITQ